MSTVRLKSKKGSPQDPETTGDSEKSQGRGNEMGYSGRWSLQLGVKSTLNFTDS